MNEKIDWFGITPKRKKVKTKLNSKSNYHKGQVNYLGLGPKVPRRTSFLGLQKKRYKMKPSSLFIKESTKKKRLSKWGDADLDGSPNYFDCDPRSPFKDFTENKNGNRPPIDAQGLIDETKSQESIIGQVKAKIKAEKEAKRKERINNFKGLFKGAFRREEPTYSSLREAKGKYKSLEAESKTGKAGLEEGRKKEKISPEEYKAGMEEITERETTAEKQKNKIAAVEARSEKIKSLMKGTGLAGTLDVARFNVEEKLALGKKPSKKELSALAKAEKRAKFIGTIQQEGKLSRELLTKAPGGELLRIASGAAVDKSGEYTRSVRAKAAKMRRLTQRGAGILFGDSLFQQRFDSEPRGRGRPAGPSGEYKIGGKPVYEAEFQQYAAKQNAMNRMLPSNTQSQTLNPEYIALLKAKAAAERGETQQAMTEEGMPMEGEVPVEDNMPTSGSTEMQTGQQQLMMQQKRAYTAALPEEIKAAQQMAQQMDNPLNAPNFMKGELKATGGSLLTPIGPSILEAPQVFKGEMRNVYSKKDEEAGEVKLGERPQTNPYGDEYLDIELGSGKPVIRKRISEKWMDGRAL